MALKPINIAEINKNANNTYEAVIVAARRARMINDENRLEFNTMLSTLIPQEEDEFEERDISEQIKISVEFEKRPKPHEIALEELLSGKLKYRYKD
jgi:DNA-directed RNA polymerase omega subunit